MPDTRFDQHGIFDVRGRTAVITGGFSSFSGV